MTTPVLISDRAEQRRASHILRYAAAADLFPLAQTLLAERWTVEASFHAMREACGTAEGLLALQAARDNLQREELAIH